MTLTSNILMIIAPRQFRDEELLVPRHVFIEHGLSVETVSTQLGTATGMLGGEERITKTLEDICPDDYDAAVVVGGMGASQNLLHNARLHAILKAIAQKSGSKHSGIVAGICLSGALPALAGLAAGKRCTVYETPETLSILQQAGALYTNDAVTVDGCIITANGPSAAKAFAEAIVAALSAKASSCSLS
ncbi:MAG: DJ-1/PfpI family protein [Vampirovibrionales bacterium]|nr:DJ-1/PfpI family protein [Vampirovibrionales bacterium]